MRKGSDGLLDVFSGLDEKEAASLALRMIEFGKSERQKGEKMGNFTENPPSLDEIHQQAVGLANEAAGELRRQYQIPYVKRDLKRQAALEKQLVEGLNIADDVEKTFAASAAASAKAQADAEEVKNAPLLDELNRLYKTPSQNRARIKELEKLLGWSK